MDSAAPSIVTLNRSPLNAASPGEILIVVPHDLEAGIRRPVASAGFPARIIHEEQPAGILHGQRLQHHRVHQRKDRRVRAEAEPQRQNRHRRKSWTPPHHAGGISQIAPQIVEQCHSPRRPALLAHSAYASELHARSALRLRPRHALPHQIFSVSADVKVDLTSELLIHPAPMQQRGRKRSKLPQNPHTSFGAARSTVPITSPKDFHSSVSIRSWRFPAAVKL